MYDNNKMIRKTILTIMLAVVALSASAQTPMVDYYSTRHYHHRVAQFHNMPMPTSDNIVMLGNSLTEFGGDWNKRIPEAGGLILNRGIKGDDAEGMRARLCQIMPGRPKQIFVGCGINDVSHALTNGEVAALVEQLLAEIRRLSPETKVCYFSLLPINESFGRWRSLDGRTDDVPLINAEIRRWCGDKGVTFIDLFPLMKEDGTNTLRKELTVDGLHLNEAGYEIWVSELRKWIE